MTTWVPIVAYLRSQPAVKNVVPKSEYRMKLPPNYGPALKTKVRAPLATKTMKYNAYKNISDDDMKALTAYLRSLKAVPFGGQYYAWD
jgi:cytochrome c1